MGKRSRPRKRTSASSTRHETRPVFDYHRTIIGYHGTRRQTASELADGAPFDQSTNDDDWLGHGVYFWEYAPRQAWWWANRRYGSDAAVIGAMIRLGRCLDLLDPDNVTLVAAAQEELAGLLRGRMPRNHNKYKYLDCAVFNYLYSQLDDLEYNVESTRAIFVPMVGGGLPRLWERSGVLSSGHIQVCVREARNILAVWSVRRDGRYGKDE